MWKTEIVRDGAHTTRRTQKQVAAVLNDSLAIIQEQWAQSIALSFSGPYPKHLERMSKVVNTD